MNKPGSDGEHLAQERYDTVRRALAFYNKQMLDHLNDEMRAFVSKQSLFFIATADKCGECDCSLRAWEPGVVHALSEKVLAYPEYKGNGVMASIGNMLENPHIGLNFIDFFTHTVGLHVNGRARVLSNAQAAELFEQHQAEPPAVVRNAPERWVVVDVQEAFIHCSKHIPHLQRVDEVSVNGEKPAVRRSSGDFFRAKASSARQLQQSTKLPAMRD